MTSPRTPASLSTLEFIGGQDANAGTTTERWLDGTSEAIGRLRDRLTATGAEGFAAAVICGPAGSGRLRAARCLHDTSRRAASRLVVIEGDDANAAASLADVLDQTRRGAEGAPGNVIIRSVERCQPDVIAAAVELLTGQGLELRCGLVLVTAEPLAALRSRSLQHGQLFARCGRAILQVPPVTSRLADVPVLAKRFLMDAVRRYGKPVRGISPQAMTALQRHDYPGNVRELSGLVEQAVLAGTSDWLTVEDFPRLSAPQAAAPRRGELVIRMPGSSLREIELQALRLALQLTDGRIVRAAELLGITRHALRRKLEKHGLNDLRRSATSAAVPQDDDDAFI